MQFTTRAIMAGYQYQNRPFLHFICICSVNSASRRARPHRQNTVFWDLELDFLATNSSVIEQKTVQHNPTFTLSPYTFRQIQVVDKSRTEHKCSWAAAVYLKQGPWRLASQSFLSTLEETGQRGAESVLQAAGP